MKKSFAVIGHPLGHTMSPYIHKALFSLSGMDTEYSAYDIPPEALGEKIGFLKTLGGYNITIPHKQTIIPFLDRLDGSAEKYGAVNLVKCGDECVGYNTDAYGFLKALETAGISFGEKTIICGCGGVARTMAYEAVSAGSRLIFSVLKSDFDKAQSLKDELCAAVYGVNIEIKQIGTFAEECSLLVNATPVGMYPNCDAMPVSKEQISLCCNIFDAVYNPRKTMLLKTAEELEVNHGEGMAMLVWQAARAHEIWYNAEFSNNDIAAIIDGAYAEMAKIF